MFGWIPIGLQIRINVPVAAAFFKKAIYYIKLGAHKSKLKSMHSLIYSSLSFSNDPHVNKSCFLSTPTQSSRKQSDYSETIQTSFDFSYKYFIILNIF